jgi:hypothetical protein
VHPEELEELIGRIEGVAEVVVHGDKKHIYAEIYKDPDLPEIKEKHV